MSGTHSSYFLSTCCASGGGFCPFYSIVEWVAYGVSKLAAQNIRQSDVVKGCLNSKRAPIAWCLCDI